MKSLLYLLLSPIWAATGCYPKRLLAEKPLVSFRVYSAVFFLTAFIHYPPAGATGFLLYTRIVSIFFAYFSILLIFSPRWQVAILMAWIGTDLIFFATGLYSAYVDFGLFLIYLGREIYGDYLISKEDSKKLL